MWCPGCGRAAGATWTCANWPILQQPHAFTPLSYPSIINTTFQYLIWTIFAPLSHAPTVSINSNKKDWQIYKSAKRLGWEMSNPENPADECQIISAGVRYEMEWTKHPLVVQLWNFECQINRAIWRPIPQLFYFIQPDSNCHFRSHPAIRHQLSTAG